MAPTKERVAIIAVLWTSLAALGADRENSISADKQALAPVQAYVGQWRGVGQPKRGSNQGAWTEEAQWAWRFEKGHAELVAELTRDKYYARLQLQPGKKSGEFVLLATISGADPTAGAAVTRRFTGSPSAGAMVFTADEPQGDMPGRISLRLVADGDRLLVLYEKRVGDNMFARLAEVGATRKGSSFATASASGPECVVTGGLGTIAVEHDGKKYFVCCTGCRDLFREDPEGVLAEYRQRKAAEGAEKNK